MLPITFVLLFSAAVFAEPQGFRVIQPTYRPPPRIGSGPIRTVREADHKPLWLYDDDVPKAPATGDHPRLPQFIDDIRLNSDRRYARSLDSPGAKRGGGSHTTSSGSRNTGATHPGYNRRNARDIRLPELPFDRRPQSPPPFWPDQVKPLPIYARTVRQVDLSSIPRKPTYRDVPIPNWNPHVRKDPRDYFGRH